MEFSLLTKNIFDDLRNLFPGTDSLWAKYKEKRLNQLDKKEIDIFIIKENGKIIGEITTNYISHALEEETIPNKRVYFEAFRIQKKYQNQGLGQALINYAINFLKGKNYSEFTIGVEDDNQIAKYIFFKLGFVEPIANGHGDEFDPCDYTLYLKRTSNLKLVIPTKKHEKQVMDYREEFFKNNEYHLDGCSGLEEVNSYDEWLDFENRLSKRFETSYVPSTTYLAVRISDNKLVGIIDFRHNLNDFLLKYGGNIGYSVAPSERRKGYAKEMLSLVLEKCKEFGAEKVLLTCDKNNIASSKTIIHNGGILKSEILDDVNLSESGIIQRYWIKL